MLTPAIFGLIGVAVGGVLNLLAALYLERARERREAKMAALLVLDELRDLSSSIARAEHDDSIRRLTHPPRREWDRHRQLLARVMPEPDYRRVSEVYRRAHTLADDAGDAEYENPITEDEEADIQLLKSSVAGAIGPLTVAAGTWRYRVWKRWIGVKTSARARLAAGRRGVPPHLDGGRSRSPTLGRRPACSESTTVAIPPVLLGKRSLGP